MANVKLNNHIFLIGMPGSGKTKLANEFSTSSKSLCIDTDKVINVKTGLSVNEYWQKFGEVNFRSLERQVLFEFSGSIPAIISTGGGMPCFFDNMSFMLSYGKVIYIQTDLHLLIERNRNSNNPVFHEDYEKSINDLYVLRRKYYERAHFSGSYSDCASYLLQLIRMD